LSTLHTNDSASAITRLLDMHIEPYLISSSLLAVMAQRLVRVICPDCKTACRTEPPAGERTGAIDPAAAGRPVYTGAGCEHCLHTGYVGRTGIFEMLLVDPAIQDLIVQRAAAHAIKQQAVRSGMLLLRQDGLRQVAAGITTMEEVLRVTQDCISDAQEASVHADAE
ncbi:MAG: Flp pilus assembly complex ATPase component TadA, partial [Sedimentisphaerales bacterium]|nr:Flp pilus assembly complex ATPase component TadA [Sedimentisphaerales bacterium]